jgi:hypothetical protein
MAMNVVRGGIGKRVTWKQLTGNTGAPDGLPA